MEEEHLKRILEMRGDMVDMEGQKQSMDKTIEELKEKNEASMKEKDEQVQNLEKDLEQENKSLSTLADTVDRALLQSKNRSEDTRKELLEINTKALESLVEKEIESEGQRSIEKSIYRYGLDGKIIKGSTTIDAIHFGYSCSMCNKRDFIGVRFQCKNCDNFHRCPKCQENEIDKHDRSHIFKPIREMNDVSIFLEMFEVGKYFLSLNDIKRSCEFFLLCTDYVDRALLQSERRSEDTRKELLEIYTKALESLVEKEIESEERKFSLSQIQFFKAITLNEKTEKSDDRNPKDILNLYHSSISHLSECERNPRTAYMECESLHSITELYKEMEDKENYTKFTEVLISKAKDLKPTNKGEMHFKFVVLYNHVGTLQDTGSEMKTMMEFMNLCLDLHYDDFKVRMTKFQMFLAVGDLEKAKGELQKILEEKLLGEDDEGSTRAASLYHSLGVVFKISGNNKRAFQYFNSARPLLLKHKSYHEYSTNCVYMVDLCRSLGDFQSAKILISEVRELKKENADFEKETNPNIWKVLDTLEREIMALQGTRSMEKIRATRIKPKSRELSYIAAEGKEEKEALDLYCEGMEQQRRGKSDVALTILSKAVEKFRELQGSRVKNELAKALYWMGLIHKNTKKDFSAALPFLSEAAEIFKSDTRALSNYALVLRDLGEVYLHFNKFNESLKMLSISLNIAQLLNLKHVKLGSTIFLGRIFGKMGDFNKQKFFFDEYLMRFLEFLAQFQTEEEKIAFIQTNFYDLSEVLNPLVPLKRFPEFVVNQSFLKSITLMACGGKDGGVNLPLINIFQSPLNEPDFGVLDPVSLHFWTEQPDCLTIVVVRNRQVVVMWSQEKVRLEINSLVDEFLKLFKTYCKGGIHCVVKSDRSSIVWKGVNNNTHKKMVEMANELKRISTRLYDLLIRRVEEYLPNNEYFVIYSWDYIQRVPFNCLFDGEKYFLEKFEYSFCTSIFELLHCKAHFENCTKKRSENETFPLGLIVGDPKHSNPLRNTEELLEVKKLIESQYLDEDEGETEEEEERGGTIELLSQTKCKKEIVIEELQKLPKIAYFSTHGKQPVSVRPYAFPAELSGGRTKLSKKEKVNQFEYVGEIQLSKGSPSITAKEIRNMDISGVETVFLNACTLAGGNISCQGTLGFTRAFFRSGVPFVISSLYECPNQIGGELGMKYFHYRVKKKLPKIRALSMAIKDLFELETEGELSGETLSVKDFPFLWCTFQCYGYEDTMFKEMMKGKSFEETEKIKVKLIAEGSSNEFEQYFFWEVEKMLKESQAECGKVVGKEKGDEGK